jgi:hypothetical protein
LTLSARLTEQLWLQLQRSPAHHAAVPPHATSRSGGKPALTIIALSSALHHLPLTACALPQQRGMSLLPTGRLPCPASAALLTLSKNKQICFLLVGTSCSVQTAVVYELPPGRYHTIWNSPDWCPYFQSRQSMPGVDCVRNLARIGSVKGVSIQLGSSTSMAREAKMSFTFHSCPNKVPRCCTSL